MKRKFTKYPKKSIHASSDTLRVLHKAKLIQEFTDAFNNHFGGVSADFNPAKDYYLRIDINQDGDGVMVDIEAETDFDANEVFMDYYEYKSIMEEIGQPFQSKSDYYDEFYNQPTLENKMDEVIQAYNPEWYFELYNACRIQAYLDGAVLEA